MLVNYDDNSARIVAGLMSGTSVDAIDTALVSITPSGTNIDVELLAYAEYPWTHTERDAILRASSESVSAQFIAMVDRMIGDRFCDALDELTKSSAVSIDAIGFHGQTIAHVPAPVDAFAPSTLQIGQPHACARRFKCPVVFDFRRADIVAGGQGAPLVPAADNLIFHRAVSRRAIAIQNIGGIGNITYLAPDSAPIGFDTGPGNMVLDQIMVARTGHRFDVDGSVAGSGTVNNALLQDLKRFNTTVTPPVSYGREQFGMQFLERLLKSWSSMQTADMMATVSEWTASTIADAIHSLPSLPDEIYVAGGGAKNTDLIKRLEKNLGRKTRLLDELGIESDAREAVAFAVLADARLRGLTFDLRNVTGSKIQQGLGAIALP